MDTNPLNFCAFESHPWLAGFFISIGLIARPLISDRNCCDRVDIG